MVDGQLSGAMLTPSFRRATAARDPKATFSRPLSLTRCVPDRHERPHVGGLQEDAAAADPATPCRLASLVLAQRMRIEAHAQVSNCNSLNHLGTARNAFFTRRAIACLLSSVGWRALSRPFAMFSATKTGMTLECR